MEDYANDEPGGRIDDMELTTKVAEQKAREREAASTVKTQQGGSGAMDRRPRRVRRATRWSEMGSHRVNLV